MENILTTNHDAATLAEVALCVWEEVLHRERSVRGPASDCPEFAFFKQDEGVAMARSNVIDTAHMFETAYQHAVDRYDWDYGFDWEFVPRVLDYFVKVCDTPADITEVRAREAARYASNGYAVDNQPE